MFFVYVLQSLKDRKYYIGYTGDLKVRIKKHNKGHVKSTKHRRPLKLVYYETLRTRKNAYRREQEIKRMKGGIQFKQLIESSNGHRKAGSRLAG
ncbi:MAG: GIY-YIG nuclease family protein [Patescibacteria group bacterium]